MGTIGQTWGRETVGKGQVAGAETLRMEPGHIRAGQQTVGMKPRAETVRKLPRVCSVRYRYSRHRYGCHTELTEVLGTGINVVPELPTCPAPV